VTLRSLFEPFGKDVSKQIERLQAWANLRRFSLRPRGVTENRAENLMRDSWVIDRRHVAQAIAELDPRGMADDVRAGFVRVHSYTSFLGSLPLALHMSVITTSGCRSST